MKSYLLSELVDSLGCSYGKDSGEMEVELEVVKVSNINSQGRFHKKFETRSFSQKEVAKLSCKKGDLLVVKSSGSKKNILSGKTAICDIEHEGALVATNFLMRLRPNKELVEPKYLWYVLNSEKTKDFIKTIVGTTTYPNLRWNMYGRLKVELPTLAEQQRVTAILDKADEINSASKSMQEIREKLIFSTFNSMFENVPLTKIDPLHFQMIDGDRGANYPKREEFSSKGYCLFLSTKNVRHDGFEFTKTEYVSKERHEKLRKGHLQRNDVVLTTRGTVGNVALYDESVQIDVVRINSGMLILRPNAKVINPRYLFHLIQMPVVQRQFDRIASGSAQPQLPIIQLRRLEIPIPSLKLQNKFAEIVNNMVKLDCYTLQEKTGTLPLSLLQDLIS